VKIQAKTNPKIITKDNKGHQNGFLVPIYNIHEEFFEQGREPQQVYLTVIGPGQIKGPHLHHIRTGCFTCIKGNVRFVLKTHQEGYQEFLSGENHEFRTVMVQTGIATVIQNLGEEDAYVLNMPNPAWTPEMQDEYIADFSDFDFSAPRA